MPPVYQFNPPDGSSPLRRFTALPNDNLLVLGARRTPPIACPAASTHQSLSILTSVGFRQLLLEEYHQAITKLKPDIIIGAGDIPHGAGRISAKKTDKITDRTARWMLEHIQSRKVELQKDSDRSVAQPLLYAPLLPLPIEAQRWYIDQLVEDMRDSIQGLAVYDTCALSDLPSELSTLPRLALTEPKNPRRILQEIAQGIDIFTIPFIGAATDAGIALDFTFGNHSLETATDAPQPLGVDMWQLSHAADVSPLSSGCFCYACSNHHRAFLQHLLSAKEMLGWVLLQIHNHCIISNFFTAIRNSISKGTFEEDRRAFERVYEPELPAKTGQGPRYAFAFSILNSRRMILTDDK